MLKWLWLAVLASSLFLVASVCGKEPPDNRSLASVLASWKQSRVQIIKVLDNWDQPLGHEDAETLLKFAEERDQQWRIHYAAVQLLRRNHILKKPSEKVAKAEELLLNIRGWYDPETSNQLAELGPEIIPLLKDLLNCDAPYEQNVALPAIGEMEGNEAIEALRWILEQKHSAMAVGKAVPALLEKENDDVTIDWLVKIVSARDKFNQSCYIRAVQDASVPNSAKMRFYSHYDEFSDDGKQAAIRALGALGTKEAFDQLSAILIENRGDTTLQLAKMNTFDPSPVFVGAFEAGQVTSNLMMFSAIRGCKETIPYLEKIKTTEYQYMKKNFPVVAAAALARLGKDVEQNTVIVKTAISQADQDSYMVDTAGAILCDETIVKLVIAKAKTKNKTYEIIHYPGWVRNPVMAKVLRETVESFPISSWRHIGETLEELGMDLKDEETRSYGAGLQAVIEYVGLEGAACFPQRDNPVFIERENKAVAFMKKNPQLFKKLFSETLSPPGNDFGLSFERFNTYTVALARLAWTPELTTIIEDIIKTDQTKFVDSPEGIEHYWVRQSLAQLLQQKTGKPYTYVDVDGKIKNAWDEIKMGGE